MYKLLILLFSFLTIFISCKKEIKVNESKESDTLFQETSELINKAITELEEVKDTSDLKKTIERFDSELTRINYKYSPGTDYSLSEEQNDSLLKLFNKFIEIKNQKISNLNLIIEADSIPISIENT